MADVSLSLLVLKTFRLDELRAFYHTLGIEFTEEQHGKGPRHLAGMVGDLVLEFYPVASDGPIDSTTRLGFAVEKLDEVFAAFQAFGSPVVTPPQKSEWGYRAVVRDPDGRAVEISQR